MLYDRLSSKLLIKKIKKGIEEDESIKYFEEIFNVLLTRTNLLVSDLKNDDYFRIRILEDKLFEHINELKYPPKECCRKGRLNDEGEQVAYMSIGEVSPLAELDISYYQIYCLVKIKPIDKNIYFHYAGIKGKYSGSKALDIEINELMRDILNTKSKKFYNATIALGHFFLNKNSIGFNGEKLATGLAYSSVLEDKSNKNLYNVAVNAVTFDEKFEIIGADYNLLTYDCNENCIVLNTMNSALILSNGSLKWEKTYNEMMDFFYMKYRHHVFFMQESNGIVHYKYGGGTIIEETDQNYKVDFPCGVIIVSKAEINDA